MTRLTPTVLLELSTSANPWRPITLEEIEAELTKSGKVFNLDLPSPDQRRLLRLKMALPIAAVARLCKVTEATATAYETRPTPRRSVSEGFVRYKRLLAVLERLANRRAALTRSQPFSVDEDTLRAAMNQEKVQGLYLPSPEIRRQTRHRLNVSIDLVAHLCRVGPEVARRYESIPERTLKSRGFTRYLALLQAMNTIWEQRVLARRPASPPQQVGHRVQAFFAAKAAKATERHAQSALSVVGQA